MTRYSAAGAALAALLALTATAQAARTTPDPEFATDGVVAHGLLPLETPEAPALAYRRHGGVLEISIHLDRAVRIESVRLRCWGGNGPVVAILGGLADAGPAAANPHHRHVVLRDEDVIATDGSSDACPYVIETLDDLAGAIEFGDIQLDLQAAR